MHFNRRQFLATSTAAAFASQFSVRWAKAETAQARAVIVVFLRGGLDTLNFVAPADDRHYEKSRPIELRVASSGTNRGLPLGGLKGAGEFLLHPAARALMHLWRKKRLAMIPAAGLNNATRSHFQAMRLIEAGISADGQRLPADGWLTRLALALGQSSPGSTISLGGALPQSLSLCESAIPLSDQWDVAWLPSVNFRDALFDIHSTDSMLDRMSRQAIEATDRLAMRLDRDDKDEPVLRDPPAGIRYPDHDFARKLKFLAELMRVSPEIALATADLDGWDTHENQKDQFSYLIGMFSESLVAFHDHLDALGRPATVVVMSEFGRRVKSNESGGTDHGHGGMMMVLGDGVRGGKAYGTWPGLAPEQLDQRMDLAVTTDFRDVLATVAAKQGAQAKLSEIFPGHTPQLIKGLLAG